MSITAGILVKNEEDNIFRLVDSLHSIVDKILIIDDSSEDMTALIAMSASSRVNVIQLPDPVSEKGFANALNFMAQNCQTEWLFWIDADELLSDAYRIHELTRFPNINAWALPRRKYSNYTEKARTEFEAYPDWQVRMIRMNRGYFYEGQLHVRLNGGPISYAYRGPHIEHLQDELRTPEKLIQRSELYSKLSAIQGVAINSGITLEVPNE